MIKIGSAVNRNVTAVLSDMDVPLGNAIGNLMEVMEAVEVLTGGGPQDLKEVCLTLATHMLYLAEKGSLDECKAMAQKSLTDGSAFKAFCQMVEAHGGRTDWLLNPSTAPVAPYTRQVKCTFDGYISKIDTEKIGITSLLLGAGRKTKEDAIDPLAGLILHKKTGDHVKKGEAIATLYTSDQSLFKNAQDVLIDALTISQQPPKNSPAIIKVITKDEV